jgi:hypothetical protein
MYSTPLGEMFINAHAHAHPFILSSSSPDIGMSLTLTAMRNAEIQTYLWILSVDEVQRLID